MKTYALSEDLVNAILANLSRQPYTDVNLLIEQLNHELAQLAQKKEAA